MRTQLARLSNKKSQNRLEIPRIKAQAMKQGTSYGPTGFYREAASNMLNMKRNSNNLWFIGDQRNIAVAAELLQRKEVIAIPTDTIYGLACLANDATSIQKLYNIKGRDFSKPVAICLDKREDVEKYGVITDAHRKILPFLLPGPYTIILKRTENVHQDLNPDHDTIGIRVVDLWFTRAVVAMVGPIALTSANKSGEKSCIAIEEFSELWPELGGVFHNPYLSKPSQSRRMGSTIFDLSIPGKYSVIRRGIGYENGIKYLRYAGVSSVEAIDSEDDIPEAAAAAQN